MKNLDIIESKFHLRKKHLYYVLISLLTFQHFSNFKIQEFMDKFLTKHYKHPNEEKVKTSKQVTLQNLKVIHIFFFLRFKLEIYF